MPSYKKTLCLDFDGVIHSYTSGWQGVDTISDPPVPGAFEALHTYCQEFIVVISSSRSADPRGIHAMKTWFLQHGWESDENGDPKDLLFPMSKPPAFVTIDDRSLTFTGTFPSAEELQKFQPWYKRDVNYG